MKTPKQTWAYSAFGGGGALTSLWFANGCSGACTTCFGCVAAAGSLAVLALSRNLKSKCKEEDQHGMVETGH